MELLLKLEYSDYKIYTNFIDFTLKKKDLEKKFPLKKIKF